MVLLNTKKVKYKIILKHEYISIWLRNMHSTSANMNLSMSPKYIDSNTDAYWYFIFTRMMCKVIDLVGLPYCCWPGFHFGSFPLALLYISCLVLFFSPPLFTNFTSCYAFLQAKKERKTKSPRDSKRHRWNSSSPALRT